MAAEPRDVSNVLLEQSPRLTAAVVALALTVPDGFANVDDFDGAWDDPQVLRWNIDPHQTERVFPATFDRYPWKIIDLRDPLTRHGLTLLVAEAFGVSPERITVIGRGRLWVLTLPPNDATPERVAFGVAASSKRVRDGAGCGSVLCCRFTCLAFQL